MIMDRVLDWLENWRTVLLSLLIVGYLAVDEWMPASPWMTVDHVSVRDGFVGEDLTMIVNRTIHRDFAGQWIVQMRRQGTMGWHLECSATGPSIYKKGSELPYVLTMKWWVSNQCVTQQPGIYKLETTWMIDVPFVDNRVLTVESNPFMIRERQEQPPTMPPDPENRKH